MSKKLFATCAQRRQRDLWIAIHFGAFGAMWGSAKVLHVMGVLL